MTDTYMQAKTTDFQTGEMLNVICRNIDMGATAYPSRELMMYDGIAQIIGKSGIEWWDFRDVGGVYCKMLHTAVKFEAYPVTAEALAYYEVSLDRYNQEELLREA